MSSINRTQRLLPLLPVSLEETAKCAVLRDWLLKSVPCALAAALAAASSFAASFSAPAPDPIPWAPTH